MRNLFNEKHSIIKLMIAIFLLASAVLPQEVTGQPAAGTVKLSYNYPVNKPVRYVTEGKIIQTMEIQGQAMQVNVNSIFGCTLKAIASPDKNLKLQVTVDTIGQSMESPMGSTGGGVKDVQGKVFNIVINPVGKSVDISEAESIVYNIEGSGESNLAETFINFFPVLPDNPVKQGDTWTSTDSLNTRTQAMTTKMSISSENKMEGFENIDGVECARISAILSGNRVMTVSNQDVDILIKGPFTGKADFFFSLKDGYFVRQVVTSRLTGNMEMTSPQTMTFPIVMEINSVNEVKK